MFYMYNQRKETEQQFARHILSFYRMQKIISRVTCLIFSLHLQTEEIEGIQHDHSITSKINLVDLAGSERQSQAQTSGERLRVGTGPHG